MGLQEDVLLRMQHQLRDWEDQADARLIFLSCYQMMTSNVMKEIETQTFEDNGWVQVLMDNFAAVYFEALDQYEQQAKCPQVWQEAFQLAPLSRADTIQNLLLGVNAHINYDLVFVLAALLQEEWPLLDEEKRQLRYRDHCQINHIIHQTIDAVQDEVIERFSPRFDLIDKLMGPMDEWLTARLISEWRDDVWDAAIAMIENDDETYQQEHFQTIERQALNKMRLIISLTGGKEVD